MRIQNDGRDLICSLESNTVAETTINLNLNLNHSLTREIKRQHFDSLLCEAQVKNSGGLKISNHAQKRLEQRQISLTIEDLERVNQAVESARLKGARDVLILYHDLRLITSAKNNTIVTALCESNKSEDIFTNIDSVVIVND